MNALVTAKPSTEAAVTPHVLEVIRSVEQELVGLLQQRAEINRRMSAFRQMLTGLSELYGSSAVDTELFDALDYRGGSRQKGLTRACRIILMESGEPLRARQGCAELRRRFPEVAERHKDLRASVTTVFHRLAGYSEARCSLDKDGQRVWEWAKEHAAGPGFSEISSHATQSGDSCAHD